uniref:Uncharacterized protein n=1 Tax=Compsopogon caeruleus TaxID=31354 RepID=A0A7S1TIL7_9RHOD|mmetsp:Transcript_5912/g.11671  ORF Transcript_5912/g.11671 Transcript_5912/m.11671 type:complete len:117 (+) Transcript_5912:2-352(+)
MRSLLGFCEVFWGVERNRVDGHSGVVCGRRKGMVMVGMEGETGTWRVCRLCKGQYDPGQNTGRSCRRHSGYYSGRLNRVNDVDTSDLEYFWNCCGEESKHAHGCEWGHHVSYDEDV